MLSPVVGIVLLLAPLAAEAQPDGGTIVAWGSSESGECDVPAPNEDFVAVAAGSTHALGLKSDGTIVAWPYWVEVPPPNEGFVAIASGFGHNMGLKAEGSIVAWGQNVFGECDVPEPNGNFAAIAAGWCQSLGLKADGSIVAWGLNDFGQCDVPASNADFVAFAGGEWHSLGLKSDGTIVGWGWNNWGQCTVPDPNTGFVGVAAGLNHSLGLKSDGTIRAWGCNAFGDCDVPEPNADFVAVSAGALHSLGRKSDGRIVGWGCNESGQCSVPPPNKDFIALAGGEVFSLGLRRSPPTPVQIVEATAGARDRDVLLRWRMPINVRGASFQIYRRIEGDDPDGEPDLGERLSCEPLTSEDGEYEFVDSTVHSHMDYEYRIEIHGDGLAPGVVRTLRVRVGSLHWSIGISVIHPHPVSGPATIALEIPGKGRVTLDLVEVVSRRVGRLVDTEMDEGIHELTFVPRRIDASERSLRLGVYYLVLRCGGRTEGKPIIVAR